LHAELLEDVAQMHLDRVGADHQGARNLLIRRAGGDEFQHLDLAVTEGR